MRAIREVDVGRSMDREVPFTLRHRSDHYCSGRAWPGIEIVVSIGVGVAREEAEELILHELLHFVMPAQTGHGKSYRYALMRAAREWWPGVKPIWEGNVYKMDKQIRLAARALHEGTTVEAAEGGADQ